MFCQSCGMALSPNHLRCARCGAPVAAEVRQEIKRRASYRLYGIGLALEIVLGIEAGASVAGIFIRPMYLVALIGLGPTIVVFLMWFYLARINAGLLGAVMRREQGWAIGAWFVPVIALWFPLQIMLDIWRANRPGQDWRPARLVGWWWACWLLAWFTSVHHRTFTSRNPDGSVAHLRLLTLSFDGTGLSKAFTGAAAVLLILIVYFITSGPVGSSAEVVQPAPAPGAPLAIPPSVGPQPTGPAQGT